jgi:hypothetical protein
MIELTHDQRQQLEKGQAVEVTDPQTDTRCVILRKDIYERLRAMQDDTVCTTAEMLDRVMAEDDANDPHLTGLQARYGAGR